MKKKRISKNCLHGQPIPEDLKLFWKANDVAPWDDIVPFTLVDELDDDFFIGYRDEDGIDPDIQTAYQRMFGHIAFVGYREDGEKVGYWLGPENRSIETSPIVELDTEGSFQLSGRNLGEYLLSCVFSAEDYQELREVLDEIGISVDYESQDELLESFNNLDREFGSPSKLEKRYQQGLDPLPPSPPSDVPFGRDKFPKAKEMLVAIGIEGISSTSTKRDVIKSLGEPDLSGEAREHRIFGPTPAWIKYQRDDCQLHFEFDEKDRVAAVTLMEPDWEPGN